MAKHQKLITVRSGEGEYENFFFSPGSLNSLQRHLDCGWFVKYIIDKTDHAAILLERERERPNEYFG